MVQLDWRLRSCDYTSHSYWNKLGTTGLEKTHLLSRVRTQSAGVCLLYYYILLYISYLFDVTQPYICESFAFSFQWVIYTKNINPKKCLLNFKIYLLFFILFTPLSHFHHTNPCSASNDTATWQVKEKKKWNVCECVQLRDFHWLSAGWTQNQKIPWRQVFIVPCGFRTKVFTNVSKNTEIWYFIFTQRSTE